MLEYIKIHKAAKDDTYDFLIFFQLKKENFQKLNRITSSDILMRTAKIGQSCDCRGNMFCNKDDFLMIKTTFNNIFTDYTK